jgi:hypothetical protein
MVLKIQRMMSHHPKATGPPQVDDATGIAVLIRIGIAGMRAAQCKTA